MAHHRSLGHRSLRGRNRPAGRRAGARGVLRAARAGLATLAALLIVNGTAAHAAQGPVLSTMGLLALGCAGLALAALVALVRLAARLNRRERDAAARDEAAARAEDAARAEAAALRALLADGARCAAVWSETVPARLYGPLAWRGTAPDLAPHLAADDARTVAAALEALRQTGRPFALTVTGADGKRMRAEGRAVAGTRLFRLTPEAAGQATGAGPADGDTASASEAVSAPPAAARRRADLRLVSPPTPPAPQEHGEALKPAPASTLGPTSAYDGSGDPADAKAPAGGGAVAPDGEAGGASPPSHRHQSGHAPLGPAPEGAARAAATPPNAPLDNAEAALRRLMDAAPQPAWLRARDGGLAYANAAFAAAVGAASLEEAQARGLDLLDEPTRAVVAAAHAAGRPYRQRVKAVSGGKRRIWDVLEVAGPEGSGGMAVDVTAEEAAGAEMGRVVSAHRRTLDQLATAVAMFAADERLVFHNAAYERLFDLESAFLDQRPTESEILEVLRTRRKVPEQANFRAWREGLRKAYRALEPIDDWWHLPGGQMLRVSVSPNAEGGITYLFDDLSERMALESRYNSLIRIQSETLDGLAEAVAVFGSDGRLSLYNEAFLDLWSLSAQALGSKPHIDAVAAMCRPLHGEHGAFQRIRAVVTGIEARERVALRLERADKRVLDGTAQPLPDGGTLVTFRDVTDSVKVERALIERNEALEAADALKNAFVGHVSYHLRTPLNTLIGYAHMMAEEMAGPLNARQKDYLGHIRTSSEALRALIDDILDLATIDAGAMALDLADIDVRATLDQVAETVADALAEGHVTLAIEAGEDAGRFVADGRRVRQILFNLLSNAIAASPAGATVTLRAQRGEDTLELSVLDQGPGVPADMADKIFERFEARGVAGGHRGAGLGLAIVRSFMALHGGSVEIGPGPSGGTRALCRFPLTEAGRREAAE